MSSKKYEENGYGHNLVLLANHLALLQFPYAMSSGCRAKSVALRPAYPSLFQSHGTYPRYRPRVGTELFLVINWTDLWWVCRAHYNVRMLNIAVNGVNVTTPSAFEITNSGGGVIFDSGTTLSYLTQPAYGKFLTAVCIYPCRCLC